MAKFKRRYFSMGAITTTTTTTTTTNTDDDGVVLNLSKKMGIVNSTPPKATVFNAYKRRRSDANCEEEKENISLEMSMSCRFEENRSSFKLKEGMIFIDTQPNTAVVCQSDSSNTFIEEDISNDDDDSNESTSPDQTDSLYKRQKTQNFSAFQTPAYAGNSRQYQSSQSSSAQYTSQSFTLQSSPQSFSNLKSSFSPQSTQFQTIPSQSTPSPVSSFSRQYRRKAYANRYPCENCNKRYAFPSVLQRHQEQSVTCKKYFAAKKLAQPELEPIDLTSPESATQPLPPSRPPVLRDGVKVYECTQCPVAFKSADNLKKHQLRHTGARPYQCTLCGKAFRQASNLTRHKHVHSEHRAFHCSIADCGGKFKTRDSLKMHMAILHGIQPTPNNRKRVQVYGERAKC